VTPKPSPDAGDAPAPSASARIVMTKIFVAGLRLEAEIGVHPHERGRAQPLVVDVELDVPSAGADRLRDTVNYETIAKAARDVAAERVTRARVRVEKPLALAPQAAGAGVEVTLVRG
jgi:dihydroneopterin aldolase